MWELQEVGKRGGGERVQTRFPKVREVDKIGKSPCGPCGECSINIVLHCKIVNRKGTKLGSTNKWGSGKFRCPLPRGRGYARFQVTGR